MAVVAYDWLSDINQFINDNSDPATKDWLFMESPMPFILLTICYLYFVTKAGPEYMKDKKPYNLKTTITIYNALQILSCVCIIYGMVSTGSFVPLRCDVQSPLNSPKIATIMWWTTMLKLTEYLETVFFVLRKKQNQVSGLHLYHHVSTLLGAWMTSKFAPVEIAVTPVVVNAFIHVLMYSYYLVALHGGKEVQQKIVTWKRFLTILQMVQFTIIILHMLNGLRSQCSNPAFFMEGMLINIIINYFMFYRFYKKTYNKTKTA